MEYIGIIITGLIFTLELLGALIWHEIKNKLRLEQLQGGKERWNNKIT